MKLEKKDLLETVTGSPSEHKAAKEEEKKMKENEEKIETQNFLIQQVAKFPLRNSLEKSNFFI